MQQQIKQREAITSYLESGDMTGSTALHQAACHGRLANVRALLAAGANPLTKDDEGWTPFHFAAANNHVTILRMLLANNPACLENPDSEGRTALHRACYYGREASTIYLLQKGANKEARDDRGKTPLHSAVSHGVGGNEKVIDILLANHANLEAKTNFG